MTGLYGPSGGAVPMGYGISSPDPITVRDELVPDRDAIVEVEHHRPCDLRAILEEIAPQAGIAKRLGAGFTSQEWHSDGLLTWNPWNRTCQTMPSRWTRGATGSTHYWIRCYQCEFRDPWFAFWKPLLPDHKSNIHLACSGVTWRYGASPEVQSSFVAKVVIGMRYYPEFGGYGHATPDYDRNTRATGILRRRLGEVLVRTAAGGPDGGPAPTRDR